MANNPQNNEEVDLGSLFVIIGRGFSNFFNFIGNLFKDVFHLLIIFLLFLKEHLVKIAIAAVFGFIIGFIIEIVTPKRYTSDLLLHPNYKSARQLYDNINFYNDLVKQKDTLRIQKTFGLDKEDAASLKEFIIYPIRNQSDIISRYYDLTLELDTLTLRSYNFEEFKNSFTDFDYKLHNVNVVADKNNVFEDLDDIIISSVVDNPYFNTLKKLTNENLNRTDSLYRKSLAQVDSLRSVYMQVMLAEARKESNGTNIDLGGVKRKTKEIELFETNRKINEDLGEIIEDKSEKYEVVNVISNFQPIGNEVVKKEAFQLAALFALVTILGLLFLKLNSYLNNYKK